MAYHEVTVAEGVDLWRAEERRRPVRVLPDACLDLLLVDGRLQVAGPDAAARVVPDSGPVVGLRLHGGRGPALLGVPADELTGTTVPLAALWGDRRAADLADRALADPRSLAGWALAAEVDPFGLRLRAILASGIRVGAAAHSLSLSARQLHRRTVADFGYGPAHLARVLRLQRALVLADRGTGWAEVAALAGYADQAHLAREVRELTGITPTELRRERVRSVQDPEDPPA